MTKSVFERNRATDFTLFDKQFQQWLRLLVLYVMERGGVPVSTTTRYQGMNLGGWFVSVCAQPHTLTEPERTALRAIPGVYLTPAAKPRRTVEVDPDRAYLWKRLQLWAHSPTSDPVTRRRWEFYYRHRKQAAEAAAVSGGAGAAASPAPVGKSPESQREATAPVDAADAATRPAPAIAESGDKRKGRADSEQRRAQREAVRGVSPVLQMED